MNTDKNKKANMKNIIKPVAWPSQNVKKDELFNALHEELLLAHQIILNALCVMAPPEKNKWATLNQADQLTANGGGTTRATKRMELLEKCVPQLDQGARK